MKLSTYCYFCSSEFGEKQRAKAEVTGEAITEDMFILPSECRVDFFVSEDNVYKLSCQKGHEFYYIYPEQKFEVLFRSAVESYTNGYLRDAVSSAAVSLERFYELCIKAICQAYDIDKKTLDESWKSISNQSERQLGAFAFLYLLVTKKRAPLLSDNLIKTRNKVTHKGYFPEESEAKLYMGSVLSNMYTILKELDSSIHKIFVSIYDEVTVGLVNEYSSKGMFVSQTMMSTILGTVVKGDYQETLEHKISVSEAQKAAQKKQLTSIVKREVEREVAQQNRNHYEHGLLIRAHAENGAILNKFVSAFDELYGPIGTHYFSNSDVSIGCRTENLVHDDVVKALAKKLNVEIDDISRLYNPKLT
ncbi:hypothetical protein BN8_02648 [Fibrisoma limi BUZ 3]|uniref:Uncharacterized protein n=1 Tax=Fibrisoma limi BUZ 3 TaxID=1185876 RepID=I2GI20_9BACT|nr:hypothetical protein [Fibrisoma limi]CCH53545.1 hypothetical protein BN8_02648 [Fibrisoma limi BUZ 3]